MGEKYLLLIILVIYTQFFVTKHLITLFGRPNFTPCTFIILLVYVDLFFKLKHYVSTLHLILSKCQEFYTFLMEYSKFYRKKYGGEEWQPWWKLFLKSLFSLKGLKLFVLWIEACLLGSTIIYYWDTWKYCGNISY